MRTTSKVQPAARRSSSNGVHDTDPRRAHNTTSHAIIAATTRAGTARNDVGPHPVTTETRAKTATCKVTTRGPTGARAGGGKEPTGPNSGPRDRQNAPRRPG